METETYKEVTRTETDSRLEAEGREVSVGRDTERQRVVGGEETR